MPRNRTKPVMLCCELSDEERAAVSEATSILGLPDALLRTLVCVHEAGHAFMAQLQGISFKNVHAKRTRGALGRLNGDDKWISQLLKVLGTPMGAFAGPQQMRMVLAGGTATAGFMAAVHGITLANSRGRPTPLRFPGDEADMRAAYVIASLFGLTKGATDKLVNRCHVETADVLSSDAAVRSVFDIATLLLQGLTLAPRDVDAVIRRAIGKRTKDEMAARLCGLTVELMLALDDDAAYRKQRRTRTR